MHTHLTRLIANRHRLCYGGGRVRDLRVRVDGAAHISYFILFIFIEPMDGNEGLLMEEEELLDGR